MFDNAAPFGIYQSDLTPDTDAERLFDLANDVNAEGFNVWSVFYAKPIWTTELHHSPTRALVDNIITDVTGLQ